jgi:hypothetical protein
MILSGRDSVVSARACFTGGVPQQYAGLPPADANSVCLFGRFDLDQQYLVWDLQRCFI